jgi:hypothetical protein
MQRVSVKNPAAIRGDVDATEQARIAAKHSEAQAPLVLVVVNAIP